MSDLTAYRDAGNDLYHKLHLSTYPVAIKYIKSKDEIPDGAIQPSAFGRKMALCQAITQSRRAGSTVAMTADDNFCTPATGMHQWVDIALEDLLESQVRQGWHKDLASEKRRFEAGATLLATKDIKRMMGYIGFVCAPLHDARAIPDSVLVFGDGVQLTHIIQALSYEHLHTPSSTFEGFGETCMKGGLIPFVTEIPQVILPGAGDRSFAGIAEHEMAVGMPADLVFYTLENLFKTGGMMNIGYPANSIMPMDLDENITPGFKFLREKIDGASGDRG